MQQGLTKIEMGFTSISDFLLVSFAGLFFFERKVQVNQKIPQRTEFFRHINSQLYCIIL